MNDHNEFGRLDKIESLLTEALRLAELGEYTLVAAKISEVLDAVPQGKSKGQFS